MKRKGKGRGISYIQGTIRKRGIGCQCCNGETSMYFNIYLWRKKRDTGEKGTMTASPGNIGRHGARSPAEGIKLKQEGEYLFH